MLNVPPQRLLAPVALSLVLATFAQAADTDWAPPTTVGTSGGGLALAHDRDGRATVAWRDAAGAIRWARLAADGTTAQGGTAGSSPTAVTIEIQMNARGDALLSWRPATPGPGGGLTIIERDDSVDPVPTVASPGEGLRGAIGPDGHVLLTWPETRGPNGPRLSWALRGPGAPATTPVRHVLSRGGVSAPALAVDARGNAIAAWKSGNRTVWAFRRGAGGSFPLRPQRLGSIGGTPVLAFTSQGEALAAWIGRPSPLADAVLTWSLRPAGGAFPVDGVAVPERVGWQPAGQPTLAVGEDGRAILGWTGISEQFAGPVDSNPLGFGGAYAFWLARRAGGPFPSAVANTGFGSGGANGPFALAIDPAGETVAVWVDAPGPRYLYSAVRPPNSFFFVKPGALSFSPLGVPAVALSRSGRAVAAWEESAPAGPVVRLSQLQLTTIPLPSYDPRDLVPEPAPPARLVALAAPGGLTRTPRVGVRCAPAATGACAVTLSAALRRGTGVATLRRVTLRLSPGETRTVVLRPARRLPAALRKTGSFTLALAATAKDDRNVARTTRLFLRGSLRSGG